MEQPTPASSRAAASRAAVPARLNLALLAGSIAVTAACLYAASNGASWCDSSEAARISASRGAEQAIGDVTR